MKELTRMENKKDYMLVGMRMDRRSGKELTRMGKRFLAKIGTGKGICINPHPKG